MSEKKRNKKIIFWAFLILFLSVTVILASQLIKKDDFTKKDVGATVAESVPQVADRDEKILFAANKNGEDVYKIKRNGRWCVILFGVEGQCYDSIMRPVFSVDGSQFAYAAEIDGHWVVVLNNNEEIIAYDGVSSIVFSPDGGSWAIVAEKKEKEIVVLNGEEGKEYEDILTLDTWSGADGQVIFNPDGESVAYKVRDGEKEVVVIDDKEGKKYDEVGNFDFSEDGNQFAYEAENGENEVMVIDDKETAINNNPSTTSSATIIDTPGASSVSSGNVNNKDKPRFTVCEKNAATGEDCNF